MIDENPDDELERMLLEAERLAQQMRSASLSSKMLMNDSPSFALEDDEVSDIPIEPLESLETTTVPAGCTEDHDASKGNNVELESSSAPSSHNSQGNEINVAVRAAREMQLALQAFGTSSSSVMEASVTTIPVNNHRNAITANLSSPTQDSTAMISPETSPIAVEPQEKQLNRSPPREYEKVATPTNKDSDFVPVMDYAPKLKWEKVETANKQDGDYTDVVDYSVKGVTRQTRIVDGVKWEKVDMARPADDDYVPLADYSSPLKPAARTEYYVDDTASAPRKRARHHRQNKRKKVLQIIVTTALVLAFLYGWRLMRQRVSQELLMTQEYMMNDDEDADDDIYTDELLDDEEYEEEEEDYTDFEGEIVEEEFAIEPPLVEPPLERVEHEKQPDVKVEDFPTRMANGVEMLLDVMLQ